MFERGIESVLSIIEAPCLVFALKGKKAKCDRLFVFSERKQRYQFILRNTCRGVISAKTCDAQPLQNNCQCGLRQPETTNYLNFHRTPSLILHPNPDTENLETLEK